MTIDNDIYDRIAKGWWDDSNPLAILRTGINPARVAYFRDVLRKSSTLDTADVRLLDVGCGGGFLAEEFARMGVQVTGVDPSVGSIAAAVEHARAAGLEIDYRIGSGEQLPFADNAFDAVSCCDVLEHVIDPGTVIGEIARVLRPDGIFFYDTINRTWRSKLVLITVAQDWRLTRIVPPSFHAWRMFITPDELQAMLVRNDLSGRGPVGIGPGRNPFLLLADFLALKRGRIDAARLGERMQMRITGDLAISYMGYAVNGQMEREESARYTVPP